MLSVQREFYIMPVLIWHKQNKLKQNKLNQSWKLRALLIPVNWIHKRTRASNLEQSSTYQKLARNLLRVAPTTYFTSIALDYSCILQFRSMEWGCLMCTNIDDAIHTSINSHAEFCFHLKMTSRRRRRRKKSNTFLATLARGIQPPAFYKSSLCLQARTSEPVVEWR